MPAKDDDAERAEWVRATVEQYAGRLTRYALMLTGDPERAKDVVQDTFAKLCAANREAVNAHVAQWLFTVCRNQAMDLRREEKRMKPVSDENKEALMSTSDSPATQLEQRELTGGILEALAQLPRAQQEVVRLKFQAGLSYREISEVTSLSVSHVGVLIHTAIKTLRNRLERP